MVSKIVEVGVVFEVLEAHTPKLFAFLGDHNFNEAKEDTISFATLFASGNTFCKAEAQIDFRVLWI